MYVHVCMCVYLALTELGYGNNAVRMETTAVYDEKTQNFILNSNSTLGQKYVSVWEYENKSVGICECMSAWVYEYTSV